MGGIKTHNNKLYYVFIYLLLTALLSGCGEPPIIVPRGSAVSTWGNQIRVLDAQRYERSYSCGEYKCYDNYVMVLIEWRCAAYGQTGQCTLSGYKFTLKDGFTNKTHHSMTYTNKVERAFIIPSNAFKCCGISRVGDVNRNFFIFLTGCGFDYQLRYNSEGKGVYYFELPSRSNCNH